MRFEQAAEIEAPPARVWDVLVDIEGWPGWTASVTKAERLDPGPIGLGSRFRLWQPKVPALVWTVSDWRPGEAFTWRSSLLGVANQAAHDFTDLGGGRTRVQFTFELSGLAAPLAGRLNAGTIRRYLELEANGLKAASEAVSA